MPVGRLERLAGARRKPDGREDLAGVHHIADRAADGDCLAGVAVETVKDAVDWRADRVIVQVRPREIDQRVSGLDLPLGLGDSLGTRSDHHDVELCLRGLLLDLGQIEGFFRIVDLALGDLVPAAKRTKALEHGRGPLDGDPRLLDRELVDPTFLGPGQRLEELERRLQTVACRRLLGQIGTCDRFVERDDRLPALDRGTLLNQ